MATFTWNGWLLSVVYAGSLAIGDTRKVDRGQNLNSGVDPFLK